jgi:MFS family permease
MLARIVYTINWFNIASIFYFIALDFKQDISMLGIITASFLIGVGLFQVPAGILAAKHGSRKIAIFGILIASSAALVSGLSGDILHMAILRFLVGIGMACFFGPSVILISRYLEKGSEGLGIGLLNSAHAIGGIVGLFGWVILVQAVGWRFSIALSGGLGLITVLMLMIALQTEDEKTRTGFRIKMPDILKILFNKSLVILGITLLGFQAASSLVLTFIVFYLAGNMKIDPVVAGFIGSLSLIIALVSSPLFGRIYDTIGHAKKLLFMSGIAAAASMIGIAIASLYIIIPSIIIAGFFLSSGFVIVYAKAKQINNLQSEYQPLAVSFVNGISLFGAFWIPILFSFVVNRLGYSVAWVLGGIVVILLILPVLRLK